MIPLKIKGGLCFIDKQDLEKCCEHAWRIRKDGRVDSKIKGNRILIHRFIMNDPKEFQIDHIDGNPLNNQKSNLRLCSNSQNQQNSKKRQGCSSKYKGVCFKEGKYSLNVNGKFIRNFENEKDAAIAYDIISKQLYGEYHRPNFLDGIIEEDYRRVSNLLIFKKEGISYYSSKYKGIGFHKNSNKWRARVKINGSWKTLGYHKTETEALEQLRDYNEHMSNS